jgi:hypothetical protein
MEIHISKNRFMSNLKNPPNDFCNFTHLEPVMDFSVLLVYHDAMTRKAYPSDVSDEEWAFVAP